MIPDPTAILLLTRPIEAAGRFAARMQALDLPGLEICLSPLIRIAPTGTPIDWQDTQSVVFTSRNGVEAASALGPRRLPCLCVGAATAAHARTLGWPVRGAATDADDLVRMATQSPPPAPLLHIAGANTRGDIAGRLTRAGLPTRVHTAYTQPLLGLSAPARQALTGTAPVLVPLFSPRTARHFAQIYQGSAPLWLATLSPAVAEPLACLDHSGLLVAPDPNADAMLKTTKQLFEMATRVERGGDGV